LYNLRKTVIAFFGVGFIPRFPGTLTSALTVIIVFLLQKKLPPEIVQLPLLFGSSLLLFLLYRSSDGKDPVWITLDEVAGQSLALMKFCGGSRLDIKHCIIGFILFRFFDIVKPPPIKQLQRLKGAFGILIDDLAAGLVSFALLNLLCLLFL